jgi:hypothetical protein
LGDLIDCRIDGPFCYIVLYAHYTTALLNSFCDKAGLIPVIRHAACTIDHPYNFTMNRFSALDHFMLSGRMYDYCISSTSVEHDGDNLSNHDPIFLHLNVDIKLIALAFRERVFTPLVSWKKASDSDLDRYRSALSRNLRAIQLPTATLLCTDM